MACLCLAIEHKIPGMHSRAFPRPGRHVRFCLVTRDFTRDPVVLDLDVPPHSILMQVWLDVFIIPDVIAEVTIKLAVESVSGIAEFRTPDLLARLGITAEDCHTLGSDHRSIDSPAWSWC